MLSRPAKHIYGQYAQNEKEYVYYQNLGVDLNAGTYILFSNVLIGGLFNH